MSEPTEEYKPSGEYRLGRLRINIWQEWGDIIRRRKCQNWICMEIVRLHFERAYYKKTLEINLALLGFNLCIEWYLGEK